MAKTMRTGRVRQIGIIVPRIYSESVNLMMEGITEELLSMDYLTVLGYSDANRDRELQYLDIMQSNRVAGIILMATSLTDIKKSSLENCRILTGSTVSITTTLMRCVNSRNCSSAKAGRDLFT